MQTRKMIGLAGRLKRKKAKSGIRNHSLGGNEVTWPWGRSREGILRDLSLGWTASEGRNPCSRVQRWISCSGKVERKGDTSFFGSSEEGCCRPLLGRKDFLPLHVFLPEFWNTTQLVTLMNDAILEMACISVALWNHWYSPAGITESRWLHIWNCADGARALN